MTDGRLCSSIRKMSRQNIRLPPSIPASSYDDSLIDIQAFGYLLIGHFQHTQLGWFFLDSF
jgi:hypothetical protein